MQKIVIAVLACLVSAPATALAQHSDIHLMVENNRIVTAMEEGDDVHPARVFESELGEVVPNFTDEPGFDCDPGTFPVGSRVGFRILDALRVWGGGNFAGVPAERMEVAFSTLSVTTPAMPGEVDGFTLPVNASGEWHRHLEFTLLAPAASGVYLLQLSMTSDAGILESEPYFIVFGQNATHEDLDQAVEWVEANLLGTPCATADFDGDGDTGTDADIEAFFACLAGSCCATCWHVGADFNADGDVGTDGDIEAFFRVLAGGQC
jgi:hypothetical protein